jgi:hypothetical protein
VFLPQFLRAVFQQPDQRPVHVSETEEAEVVGADAQILLDSTDGDRK